MWSQQWEEKTKNEVLVRGVLFDKSILLTGKFDKLECLDDKCHEVRVVDYKTGKPKSRNEIEGKTKSAQATPGGGAYKRQLVFYKLLLDLYADGMYSMKEGVLDFIEPTESGTYKKEAFVIEHDEKIALEEDIRRIAHEINTLAFWNERCGDDACEACALRDMMDARE
jgi:RecB family exonuclease